MQNNDIYHELTRLLPSGAMAQVLAALRQDTYLWQRLQQPDFLDMAVKFAGSQPGRWNLGWLAMMALGMEDDPEKLTASPMIEVPSPWLERSIQAFQSSRSAPGSGPATLEESGLLALALRERRRKTGNWSQVASEIQIRTGQGGDTHPGWRSAVACLYAIIPDPDDLLRALLPRTLGRQSLEWVVHTRLCHPEEPGEHVRIFGELLKNQPLEIQTGILRSLNLHGHAELAAAVAEKVVTDHPAFTNLRTQTGLLRLDLTSVVTRAFMMHQLAALYHVAGNRPQALSLLHSAESTLKYWLAGMYLQEMNLAPAEESPDGRACYDENEVQAILSSDRKLQDELGPVLVSQFADDPWMDRLPPDSSDPILQIVRSAVLDRQGEVVLAKDVASQGVKHVIEKVNQMGLPFWGDFVYEWQPKAVLNRLLEMGLVEEALELSRALLASRPTDIDLLDEVGRICEKTGRELEALQYTQACAGLEPENPTWRRRSGQLWMKVKNWSEAYVEFEKVLQQANPPTIQDQLVFAQAALKSEALDRAVEMCEVVLKDNPENGEAASIEGQALAASGETDRALDYLSRATLFNPEDPLAWLILARIYQGKGEIERTLETLRAAVQAIDETVPGSVEVYLALGETCLENGLESEALPSLKKAHTLAPGAVQPAYLYGKTLFMSGQAAEAHTVLEATRPAWEEQPEMAYTFARAAQESHDLAGMITALETAVRPSIYLPRDLPERLPLDWFLLYARALIGELPGYEEEINDLLGHDVRYHRAERALKEILGRDSQNYQARYYLGLTLLEKGEAEKALEIFKVLSEEQASPTNRIAVDPSLSWRVQWGLGRTALKLKKNDIALASLKDACHARPDVIGLQRDMAEACAQAQLNQEALNSAQTALKLAPNQVNNLAWYAAFTGKIGERKEAILALQTALQLEPEHPELRVNLAEWQMESGDPIEAKASLDSMKLFKLVNTTDQRRAANLYLRMGEGALALTALERAVEGDTTPSLDLLYEIARLQEQLGSVEEALSTTQKALGDAARTQHPDHIPMYLLQADLLARLDRRQAALASLEKALRVVEEKLQTSPEQADDLLNMLVEIHERFSILLSQTNQQPEALFHAEKALEINPGKTSLRSRAADLAMGMVLTERAAQIADLAGAPEALPEKMDTSPVELDFLCLQVEIALEQEVLQDNILEKAERLIETALTRAPGYPRLVAARARLLARQFDDFSSGEAFDEVLKALKQAGGEGQVGSWLIEAALESQHWDDALWFGEDYLHNHLGEARAHFAFARLLVLSAERQWLCDALNCRVHAPGQAILEERSRMKFEQAVQSALELVKNQPASTLEIQRWKARGAAVFTPSLQAVHEMVSLPSSPQNTAAIVGLLRLLRRRPAAIQAAHNYLNNPRVAMQLALCDVGESTPTDGLQIAHQLAQNYPNQPMHHILLARLASQSGEWIESLSSYENALRWWPAEPAWHDAAGDLAFKLNDELTGMMHREQALALDPTNVGYALKLGEASLAAENVSRAVEVLEMASRLRADEVKVWLALSNAYQQAGRNLQALESALRAAQIDPDSGQSYLLAGETALAMGQVDQSIEYSRKSVLRQPADERAVLFLSRVLAAEERYGEALEVLENSASSIRNTFPVAFERAKLIKSFHGAQAAVEPLEKLADEYPEEPDLLSCLAYAQMESGLEEKAEKHALKSLRLNPDQPDLSYMLGCMQHKSGQLDQAVHLLGETIRQAPDRLDAYLELAAVYQERRETNQALQVYRQAIHVTPNDHRAYYQCGLLMRDNKDYGGAESMLRRAADLAPNNSSIRRQLVAVIALNLVHNKQEVNTIS